MDALDPAQWAEAEAHLGELFDQGTCLSALTGAGIVELLARIEAELYAQLVPMKVLIPYQSGQLLSLFHEQGIVEHAEHLEEGVRLDGRVPERVAGRFKPYLVKRKRAVRKRVA
jgi:GTP-binding protein HflX